MSKKILKSLLLAICSGICLSGFFLILTLIDQKSPTHVNLQSWASIREFFSFAMVGSVICLIFGTPCLLLIDKYFSRFQSRYMVGGAVAAWVAWFVMAGPLYAPTLFKLEYWIGSGLGHVAVYVGMGFATGALFTLLLSVFERCKKRREFLKNHEGVKSSNAKELNL